MPRTAPRNVQTIWTMHTSGVRPYDASGAGHVYHRLSLSLAITPCIRKPSSWTHAGQDALHAYITYMAHAHQDASHRDPCRPYINTYKCMRSRKPGKGHMSYMLSHEQVPVAVTSCHDAHCGCHNAAATDV
eukprot:1144764-Pelagomonas_calceolata.AAC.3